MMPFDRHGLSTLSIEVSTADFEAFHQSLRHAPMQVMKAVGRAIHRYAGRFFAVAYRNLSGGAHKGKRLFEAPKNKRQANANRRQRALKLVGTGNKIAGDVVLNVDTNRLRGSLRAKGGGLFHRIWNDIFYGAVWETGRRTRTGIDRRPWWSAAWEEVGGEQGFLAELTEARDGALRGLAGA